MGLELHQTEQLAEVRHLRPPSAENSVALPPPVADTSTALPPPVAPAPEPAELNLKMFAGLGRWLREQHGDERLRQVLRRVGIDEADLTGASAWGSTKQLEILLEEVRALAGSDEDFERACTYELSEGYGPLRFVFMAATPRMLFTTAVRNFHLVSKVSRYEISYPSRGRTVFSYSSDVPESRLMCLSRQAHAKTLPTMWGLPPGHLVEKGCIAHGDDACIYDVRHYEANAIWLPVFGAVLGAGLAAILAYSGLGGSAAWILLPIVGGLIGQLAQLARVNRANQGTGEEINDTLRSVIEENTEARHEVLELNQRQRDWTRTLEHQVQERTGSLEGMVDRLRQLDQARENNIRGVSHDLRNPLSLLSIETALLREKLDLEDPDVRDLVEGHAYAVTQMQELINAMMTEATEGLHRRQHAPEPLLVDPLVDILRRRLRALAHGQGLRTSVFSTRETPKEIWCHPIVFDRVVDNLLTNAVKYTERGSIILEVDGAPGFLTIKVSDTGAGIESARLRSIFEPRGNGVATSEQSYGVGLSVVVSLLDELGGKLEVISRPGIGTTFSAKFPTQITDGPRDLRTGSSFDRVVSIMRVDGA